MKTHKTSLLAACLALPFAAACGDGNTMPPDELLAPPAAGQGIQLKMTSPIAAGQEIERCQFFTVGSEGLYINKEDVRYRAGSHHVLLYATPYTSIPTMDRNGEARGGTSVHDCPLGPTAYWNVSSLLAASQDADGAPIIDLPSDTAVKVPPGAVLLMNVHYVNATSAPVDTDVRINLYTIPAAQAKQEAGIIFFYNPFIRVPAMGEAEARMRCPVSKDVTVFNLQSHMHRRGVGYVLDLTDGTGKKIEELYTNTEWEDVPMRSWGMAGRKITAGHAIDYRCKYKNTENRVVTQGPRSTDEMCMVLGAYAPRDLDFEYCEAAGNGKNQQRMSSAAVWIGSGTKTCGETVQCVVSAQGEAGFYGCVVDSCPQNATQVSDMLHCQFNARFGACSKQCEAGGSECNNCIGNTCQSQLATCLAASCN